MRNANPAENTGAILRVSDWQFLGTGFIFRHPNSVITANHVVKGLQAQDLAIVFPASQAKGTPFAILEIYEHPNADLTVLRIDPPEERLITWPITEIFDDRGLGLDVAAYGFPDLSRTAIVPSIRYFKGHVQRGLQHSSHLGYTYSAAELSFGCPAGLSGSMLVNPQFTGRLYGVVTENIRTSTELDAILEVDESGTTYKESYHNIITYGLALWLPDFSEWIDQIIPPVSPEEKTRRSKNQHQWNAES